MNSKSQYILWLFFASMLLYFPIIGHSQENQSVEINYCNSSNLSIRKPSSEKIENYKQIKDFQYKEESPPIINSWWQKIIYWILKIIGKIFSVIIGNPFLKYLFFIALAVILILKITNTKLQALFFKKKDEPRSFIYNELEDDINNFDFDQLIAKEIKEKNFRTAVRLLYLKLLKMLNDKNLIKWQNDKTNRQYFLELKNSNLSNEYKTLYVLYEFIWYGNFDLENKKFNSIHELFNKYMKRINV